MTFFFQKNPVSYIKNGPGPSKPFNGGKRVFFVNSSEDVK